MLVILWSSQGSWSTEGPSWHPGRQGTEQLVQVKRCLSSLQALWEIQHFQSQSNLPKLFQLWRFLAVLRIGCLPEDEFLAISWETGFKKKKRKKRKEKESSWEPWISCKQLARGKQPVSSFPHLYITQTPGPPFSKPFSSKSGEVLRRTKIFQKVPGR